MLRSVSRVLESIGVGVGKCEGGGQQHNSPRVLGPSSLHPQPWTLAIVLPPAPLVLSFIRLPNYKDFFFQCFESSSIVGVVPSVGRILPRPQWMPGT